MSRRTINEAELIDLICNLPGCDRTTASALTQMYADAVWYRKVKAGAFVRNFDGGNMSHWVLPTFDRHNSSPNPKYALKERTLDEAIDHG